MLDNKRSGWALTKNIRDDMMKSLDALAKKEKDQNIGLDDDDDDIPNYCNKSNNGMSKIY